MKGEWLRGMGRAGGPLVTIVVSLAVLVLVIAWLSGAFVEKVPPGRTEPEVRLAAGAMTDEVHEISKQAIEEAVGTIKAASRSVLSAKLLATISELNVTAGDQVEPGDVLIRLDDAEYARRLEQGRQSVTSAEATREQAERDFERAQSLMASNAISRAEFDQSDRNLRVARAEEMRAQQALAEAEVMLSYTTIVAPKPGRVVDRLAEVGDMARPGEPLLVLYDAGSLRLEAPVMEQRAVELRVGQRLEVAIDALGRTFTATVDEIVPQADALSRSFLVKASLPPDDDLYEGMFGRLRIPAGERRHLCLNTDAIVRIGQLEFVDVVTPDGGLERRLVKTGQLGMPGRQEVLSGIAAGERVVLRPAQAGDAPTTTGPLAPADPPAPADPSAPADRSEGRFDEAGTLGGGGERR